jgi:hypothetical protein
MEKEIRRHIRLALSENMQLADKMYFSTGKLSEEDKDFALYLTDGKPNQYTKLICDILYYFKEHDWRGNYKSSAQAAANNALEYKKNVLPIKEWDIYKAENKIGHLISSLEYRHAILAILEELPSVLRRNLSAELRIPRDSKELSELKRLYEYFSEQISVVYHLNPERRDEILKKLITSKNNTIDRLVSWMDDSDNLIGSAWDSMDKIHEILDEHYGEGEVVAENERWLVVKVESAELMKSLGCNSQWCFSMPLSSQFDQYQHNGIVYWMIEKNDLNSQYVLIGPGDDRLFDRENNPEEGNPYMYLFRWGVPDIESLDFDDARPGGEPMRQIEDAREEWRQENSKNPRVQQLSLDLAESRNQILAELRRLLGEGLESINLKNYHILYHSTDSDFFNTIQYDNAKKGERFFNPLGNGLYFSTNEKFSRTFGKNTYYYLLPKSTKVKKITDSNWGVVYHSILKRTLKKYGINYDDLDIGEKVMFNRLGNDAPITSLNELQEVLSAPDLGYNLDNVQETIEGVVDNMNAKYGAVWYKNTDYYQQADEILIPALSFNKSLFFKDLPGNS